MKPENLSAFPQNELSYNIQKAGGMTLRDYFAAKAMQAIINTENYTSVDIAEGAYYIADAMLKYREL